MRTQEMPVAVAGNVQTNSTGPTIPGKAPWQAVPGGTGAWTIYFPGARRVLLTATPQASAGIAQVTSTMKGDGTIGVQMYSTGAVAANIAFNFTATVWY